MSTRSPMGLLLTLALIGLVTAWAAPVRAIDQDIELEANLTNPPSDRAWINVEDCQTPEAFSLSFAWSLEGLSIPWVVTQEADVFLSTSATCSTVSIEIGNTVEDGPDAEIGFTLLEGDYPEYGDDDLYLSDIEALDCSTPAEEDYYFCVRWEFEYNTGYTTDTYTYYGKAEIRYDVNPPDAPDFYELSPGDTNLKLVWDDPPDDDIAGYLIYYREEGAGDEDWLVMEEASASAEGATIGGLVNGQPYEVVVAAYDEALNEGLASVTLVGTPVPVEDFYEYYREAGGTEDGGFCFVATATYGDYGSPEVVELRVFRDTVLARSDLGRAFIAGYYQFGPRFARAIRGSDSQRDMARGMLAPLVAVAWLNRTGLGLGLFAGLGLAGLLLMAWKRRRRLIGHGGLASLLVLGMLFAGSGQARADDMEEPGLGSNVTASSVEPMFQLQLRFGPYYPKVDDEGLNHGGDVEPFKTVFGSSSEYLFELGLDYELWRGFGVLTVGGSAGFVQYMGKGRITDSSVEGMDTVTSSDTTVFNFIPMRLTVGYTFDLFNEKWDVPLLPYVSGGLSYYVWWVLDGVGNVSQFEEVEGEGGTDARGGIFGLHFSVGIKVLLDWLDPNAAAHLESEIGVLNTYFFTEFNLNWVDGFGGDHFNLSDETVMFGLTFEF